MIEQIREILKKVINPATKNSLFAENRFVKIEFENDDCIILYKRDGISVLQKKAIESEIILLLKPIISSDHIKVFTQSERSEEVMKNLNNKAAESATSNSPSNAQLKVGHGTIGQKKKINGVKKIIAVASGKGGVGKSTFSVNLAMTLKNQGFKVGLLDADIYGPSVPKLLGVTGSKPYSNEHKKILPVEAFGIKIMSFGFFVDENSPVIWRGPMLGGVLNQFFFDVDWGETDYLIIDLPPGTGDVQLSMIQNTEVDGAVIICTPQELALLDAVKGLEMFRKLNVPVVGMVENMSYFICDSCEKEHFIFGKQGVEKQANELKVKFLGGIPLEIKLRETSDAGTPFMHEKESELSKTGISYLKIAKNILDYVKIK